MPPMHRRHGDPDARPFRASVPRASVVIWIGSGPSVPSHAHPW
jgi:hypothetical protein